MEFLLEGEGQGSEYVLKLQGMDRALLAKLSEREAESSMGKGD